MTQNIHADRILILDFGSQYTQLIARRVREVGVYCEIYPWDVGEEFVARYGAKGIILSGGPESVTAAEPPKAPENIFTLGIPILGICYGMQTMAVQLGGAVESSSHCEFGYAQVRAHGHTALLRDIEDHINAQGHGLLDVWMSHGDKVTQLPVGFQLMASTESAPIAGMADEFRQFYALQFHPEVTHTKQGKRILQRFVRDICECQGLWTTANIIEDSIRSVREKVGADEVILGLKTKNPMQLYYFVSLSVDVFFECE